MMRFLRSSIGGKVVVAVTGILLLGFVVGHLAGNMLVFVGRGAMNDYAEFLKNSPELLWPARIGLVVVFLAHVLTTIRLHRQNWMARPEAYAFKNTVQASLASRYMLVSGGVVFFYVIFHLLHLTIGAIDGDAFALKEHLDGDRTRHDVYGMLVTSFSREGVSGWLLFLTYLVANLLLAWHLSHGFQSLFQSLGLRNERHEQLLQRGGLALAAIIGLGFVSIPLSCRLGLLTV